MRNLISILFFFTLLFATNRFQGELPIGLTQEEQSRINDIYSMGRETDPPLGDVRNIAEYERMEGVLIRYPFGISTAMIAEMSEDVTIYCLVSSGQQNSANNSMSNGDVNMENVVYVTGSTDSYWTRDYGPWWVVDGNREVAVVDFTYNRPRPNDNAAPLKMSELLGAPYYANDLIHAGGNYMTDGLGVSASSDLVYEENSISNEEVHQLMLEYYGIDLYHVVDDPNNTYIDHIDCWGKYLSPTKVLIREVPTSHEQYGEIEATATYFGNALNKWGEPWEVFRVWTPNDQPYTNSLILNEKVFVPIMGSNWDDEAILSYEDAMPGFEIIPFTGTWESTDALHCRIKGIPDLEMLQVFHNPINDSTNVVNNGYYIDVIIDDLSNAGLIQDSIKVFWKTSEMNNWNSEALYGSIIPEEFTSWSGLIPALAQSNDIHYFIQAADSSGRIEKSPPAGWHTFLALPTDVCLEWELGDMNNSGDLDVFDILLLSDYVTSGEAIGICAGSVGDINSDNNITVMDIVFLINMIMNP
ncbi:MAG: peptidylarginine deiminase [Candidatus Marinimicrobia bacterium]|jgi:agmatine/peptidylarginine deiminase|nr:peptidylarginine deiminase [Candidatus Neomarinimicrobiota bacterium]MBT3500764.1 peptidylarginine deiminase [Candidatus Neomarinimicrobiota bacterium]MBT3840220.1 peptidylarginine deiminase [Candidatus Neomarinimicrobiota bacterium]MBT3999009.1 peptidylarginine deiminase [Candidatus Neomarinimicrobiota bacterium]MBT4282532.1 peptidylarginine deiminase [Candidatus Neomarinimicrobiota bacterium]